MFFIQHGITRELEGSLQHFDARTYQWKLSPKTLTEEKEAYIRETTIATEWEENNCHPDGLLFCPRCYRKHFIPDNFDFLCDGCSSIIKDAHSLGFSFEFTERFNGWYTNVPSDVVTSRVELRELLYKAITSDNLYYQNRQVIILRKPSKNDGSLEVCFSDQDSSDKKNRFITSVYDLEIKDDS